MNISKLNHIIENISATTVKIVGGFFLFVLAVSSFFYTTYFASDYSEVPLYKKDNIVMTLAIIVLMIIAMVFFEFKVGFENINSSKLVAILLGYVIVSGIVWVLLSRSVPVADQGIVAYAASEFKLDIYSSLEQGGYLYVYPFQLGITALIELIYTIFGRGNCVAFQIINILFLAILFYSLYRITDLIFRKKSITNILLVLFFFCFPPILYCTFVYGTIISFSVAILAVLFQILYCKQNKKRYLMLSVVCISISVLIKSNSQIILISMIIFYLIEALKKAKIRFIIIPLILFAAVTLSQIALNAVYEKRSGVEINEGSPKILWVAMGIEESEYGNGWYNGYPYDVYVKENYKSKKSAEWAKEKIAERIDAFVDDPAYTVRFFFKKFVSEWCDPTFEGFWISKTCDGERSVIGESFYTGKLHFLSESIMNIYETIISISALLFIIIKWKKIKIDMLFLMVIILGGFLFHMIWEAKGQYTMVYFVIILPYSAGGISGIISKIKKWNVIKNLQCRGIL